MMHHLVRLLEAWGAAGFAVAVFGGLVVAVSVLAQGRARHE